MSREATPARILIVDDEPPVRLILTTLLKPAGFQWMEVESGAEALTCLDSFKPHVAIVDLQMPRMDGIETIQRLKERSPDTVCLILTGHGSVQSAVQAMKSGAFDYLTKPFVNEQLLVVVRRAAGHALLSQEVRELKNRLNAGRGVECILGDSSVMGDLRHQILRIAGADATVLIEGETGVGKDLAARAIHAHGKRSSGPFIVVNSAAIPLSLAESELFGHRKGAFTGATDTRAGKFEQANGGTLFLDEVSELPPEIQAKLLRALQEHTVDRVGGGTALVSDVRVIAASNRPLDRLVSEGKFRPDLYHRLNVIRLCIAPLRAHPEDIPAYAGDAISRTAADLGSTARSISDEAIGLLQAYSWPGNIRELYHVMQRAMVIAEGETLEIGEIEQAMPPGAYRGGEADPLGLEHRVRLSAEETERRLIVEALEKTGWNKAAAAELLHTSRRTLYTKIEKYSLVEPGSS